MAYGDWVGKRMKNPQGKIGVVIEDNNGVFRVLTVKFEDGTKEDLWLSNTCEHPEKTWDWCWEYENNVTKEKEWVKWGKI